MYVLAFVGTSHRTHMNESSHTYKWVTSHTSMSRVTHMNESRGTRKRAMAHTWKSHVTHVNVQQGRHVCIFLAVQESHTRTNHVTYTKSHTSPAWRSQGTKMSESCHIHEYESLHHAHTQIMSQVSRVTWPAWWSHGTTPPPYERVTLHSRTTHITRMNLQETEGGRQMDVHCGHEPPRQQSFGHVPRMQPSGWIMSHIWKMYVTHMSPRDNKALVTSPVCSHVDE